MSCEHFRGRKLSQLPALFGEGANGALVGELLVGRHDTQARRGERHLRETDLGGEFEEAEIDVVPNVTDDTLPQMLRYKANPCLQRQMTTLDAMVRNLG